MCQRCSAAEKLNAVVDRVACKAAGRKVQNSTNKKTDLEVVQHLRVLPISVCAMVKPTAWGNSLVEYHDARATAKMSVQR